MGRAVGGLEELCASREILFCSSELHVAFPHGGGRVFLLLLSSMSSPPQFYILRTDKDLQKKQK